MLQYREALVITRQRIFSAVTGKAKKAKPTLKAYETKTNTRDIQIHLVA